MLFVNRGSDELERLSEALRRWLSATNADRVLRAVADHSTDFIYNVHIGIAADHRHDELETHDTRQIAEVDRHLIVAHVTRRDDDCAYAVHSIYYALKLTCFHCTSLWVF